MRRGEILALKWKHINFKEGYINVVEAWKDIDEIGKPKWNKTRFVPLPFIILEKLQELRDESLQCLPEHLVFCYADGSRLGNTWWSKRFNSALEKAGIDKKESNLKPHSLRHSLNTILRAKGLDESKIQATFGWQSQRIQDNYTHWKPEHLSGQAEMIDEIFG